MLTAINFDNKLFIKAYDIYYILAYPMLTTELKSFQVPVFQKIPEFTLCISLALA